MGLEQQLQEFKEQFLRTAPAGHPALYEAKIEELRTRFATEAANIAIRLQDADLCSGGPFDGGPHATGSPARRPRLRRNACFAGSAEPEDFDHPCA